MIPLETMVLLPLLLICIGATFWAVLFGDRRDCVDPPGEEFK